MKKWVETGQDLNEVLERNKNRVRFHDKGNGHKEFEINESQGRIYYDENQTFSEPMQHWINGVLRVFGFIIALMMVCGGLYNLMAILAR